jgi:hypothetical protein
LWIIKIHTRSSRYELIIPQLKAGGFICAACFFLPRA